MVFPIIEGSAGIPDGTKRAKGFLDLVESTTRPITVDTVVLSMDTDKTMLLAIFNQLAWHPSVAGYIKTYRNIIFNPAMLILSLFLIFLIIGSFYIPPLAIFAISFSIPLFARISGFRASRNAYNEGIGIYFLSDVTIRELTALRGGRQRSEKHPVSVEKGPVDDLFTLITGIPLNRNKDPEALELGIPKHSILKKNFNFAVYSKNIDEQGVYVITDRYGTLHLVAQSDADRYVAIQPNLEYIDIPYFFKQGGRTDA